MEGTRLPALLTIGGLVIITAAVLMVVDPIGGPPPSAAPGSFQSPASPSASEAPDAVATLVGGGRGPSYDPATLTGYPTSVVGQSKLWFHAGAWWGVIVAEGTNEFRIHRLDWSSQTWVDTGTFIAEWVGTMPDVVAEGDHVYIASGGADPVDHRGVSVLRYTYDPLGRHYTLDPDFPVRLTRQSASSLSIARDAAGRLWVIYLNSGALYVTRTDGNDHVWREPTTTGIEGLEGDVDAAAMVPFGGAVAIMWSGLEHDRFSFTMASSGSPDTWETGAVAVEGIEYSDDHISLQVLDDVDGERVFAAVKTSLDAADPVNPLDPQLLLLVRDPDGTWQQHLVGRVGDRHSRPVVLLDPTSRIVYVVANAPFSGGGIYMKSSSLDRIAFPTGLGTELIVDPDAPGVRSPTSTEQLVDAGSGIVVLASDADTGEYWHAALLPDGGGDEIDRSPVTYTDIGPRTLINDRFDPFDPGATLANGWDQRGPGTYTIADTEDGRRVASVVATADGSRTRMCKEFFPTGSGSVRVQTVVAQSAVAGSESSIGTVRHAGVVSAEVRMSGRGVFSYLDGGTIVRTGAAFRPATWYRLVMTVDMDARTYAWEVQSVADGSRVGGGDGIALAADAAGPADEVCLQSPADAAPGLAFMVDAVSVER